MEGNIMYNNNNKLQESMYKSIIRSLTKEQRDSISKRIKNTNIDPIAIYKHKKSSTYILSYVNLSANVDKPFYYVYWDNGYEIGKGHKFFHFRNVNSYTELINFKNTIRNAV